MPGQHKICRCPTPGTDKASKCLAVARSGGREGGTMHDTQPCIEARLSFSVILCIVPLTLTNKVRWSKAPFNISYTLMAPFKSACPQKSNIVLQTFKFWKQLKLWLLVVHIELIIAMWFICEIPFWFSGPRSISQPDTREFGSKNQSFWRNPLALLIKLEDFYFLSACFTTFSGFNL